MKTLALLALLIISGCATMQPDKGDPRSALFIIKHCSPLADAYGKSLRGE